MELYFQDVTRSSYNFDPIKMGDFVKRDFEVAMNDVSQHNFFLGLRQTVVPRKCMRIADAVSEAPWNTKTHYLKKHGETEDLEFNFRIMRIDGCADEF